MEDNWTDMLPDEIIYLMVEQNEGWYYDWYDTDRMVYQHHVQAGLAWDLVYTWHELGEEE